MFNVLRKSSLEMFFLQRNTATAMAKVSGGELLSPSGGAGSSAFFQYQHYKYLHASAVKCNQNQNSSDLGDETKMKLSALKEKLAKNVYFEKYKEKFQQLEMASPRELLAKLEALDAKVESMKPQGSNQKVDLIVKDQQFSLKDVMELSRIKDLERDDITFLWQEFHRNKEGVLGAVMSSSVFEKMAGLASKFPMFLLPLPRDNGYEFFFVQYMNKAFHFTPLLVYQTHKENAPECLRLINYTDLQAEKDLVLMRGEFDKNLLTAKDAHVMAVQTNFYYGESNEDRRNLLETFSSKPDSFDHMQLVEEWTKLKESHSHLFEYEN